MKDAKSEMREWILARATQHPSLLKWTPERFRELVTKIQSGVHYELRNRDENSFFQDLAERSRREGFSWDSVSDDYIRETVDLFAFALVHMS